MTAVVEQATVPQLVAAFGTFMEVEVVAAIEHVQPIQHILGRVAVDDVEQDGDAHAVRGVNQLLQVVWESVAAAGREEAVDLVAKACIVGMLHDGHQLDDVVSQVLNPGEVVLRKLLVCSDFGFGGGNADMGFVYAGAGGLRRALVLEDVSLLLWRIPKARIVDGRDAQILRDALDPRGDTLLARVVVGDDKGNLQYHMSILVLSLGWIDGPLASNHGVSLAGHCGRGL